MSVLDSALDFLRNQSTNALTLAKETTSRIHSYSLAPITDVKLEYTPDFPTLAPPPTMSDLFVGVDGTNAELQRLDAETEKWITKYFPELAGCLRDKPEEWLCKIISGSDPFADSKYVIDLIWNEARDRAYRAATTETATIHALYSERGFSLPPGVAVRLTTEAEQRASQAISDVNRAESIKAADLKVGLLKFAEEQAIRLKLGIMDSLRAFYIAWNTMPDKETDRARVRAQAQSSLYGALSSYYNVELGFEQLRLKAAEAEVQAVLDVDKNKIAAFSGNRAADALAQAVKGFAEVSASAANAQSTLMAEITTGGA